MGCSSSYEDNTASFKLPPELKDYKVYRIVDENGNTLFVLVKKQGEDREVIGTTRSGKYQTHVVVIDGETYSRIEQ